MILIKENFKLRDDEDKEVIYTKITDEETNQVSHHYSYFACTCSDEDKKYWKEQLQEEFKDYDPDNHADITSQLAMYIVHVFDGGISISADMWFGLHSSCTAWNNEVPEEICIHMQCDEIPVGLMAMIKLLRKATDDDHD